MTTITMEEYELMKDSKYRMYVAAVDKALKNFEYTSEWADLISALGKLNKVLLGYTKFPVIPRRIKISKRLAQCMHPALPSGVHLKALETYDIIFKCMGTNRLSYELFIYSAGLFPLLGHAAMTIRPMLLQLYETHFVPLRERLRPALSGFLSGVLPGLEIGSDHFERTNDLLEAVCEGVGPAWFYTCMWQCVRSNSPIRLPAISYVLCHYSRKVSMEDQLYLMGNDIDVMVSGLCAAVQDSSVLVQRSALDLLMVCFPMHNTQLLYADMVRLVTAALSTILRRDMSLNRRLYSWLLGAEVNISLFHTDHPLLKKLTLQPESQSHTDAYFELYSYDILSEAIRVTLTQASLENSIDIRPYRLLTSLFDKPQIGPVILDNILYDVFRALYLTTLQQQRVKSGLIVPSLSSSATPNGGATNTARCVSFNGDLESLKREQTSRATSKQFLNTHCQELLKNANLLFNTLEPHYIWTYVARLCEDAIDTIERDKRKAFRDRGQVREIGSGQPGLLEICLLAEFLLDVIHIDTYADDSLDILPDLFVRLVEIVHAKLVVLNRFEITQSLELCTKVLTKIQPTIVKSVVGKNSSSDLDGGTGTTGGNQQVVNHQDVSVGMSSTSLSGTKIPPEITTTQTDFTTTQFDYSLQNSTELERSISEAEIKFGLEKSKSDSKINENLMSKNELLTINDVSRERSNSNQMLMKKKASPKIEKKAAKNKKSKSVSKLYELKRDDQPQSNDSTCSSDNQIPDQTEPPVQIGNSNTLVAAVPVLTSSVTTLASRVENKRLLRCLRAYRSLYVDFLRTKIIPDAHFPDDYTMLVQDADERTRHLERLLNSCLDTGQELRLFTTGTDFSEQSSDYNSSSDEISRNRIGNGSGSSRGKRRWADFGDFDKAMSLASNILLEFSTFPNLLWEEEDEEDDSGDNRVTLENNENDIPEWSKALILCACVQEDSATVSKEIQITAMSTLMELFSLAKSQRHSNTTNSSNVNSGSSANALLTLSTQSSLGSNAHNTTTNTVVITGILDYSHVMFIENSTVIIETISKILWDFLGSLHNQEQLILCVTLLYQIHNVFDTKFFVEDVIATYLIHENLTVEFFKRFSLLWHLGRNLDAKAPLNQHNATRNFDRSLLKILDNLHHNDSNLKLLAETFLTHCLLRNDIARVVSPLFAILLSPSTARISIRHINIVQNSDLQRDASVHDAQRLEDARFKKIYAISSVDGNVMYHLADDVSAKQPANKRKSFLFSKVGKSKVTAAAATASGSGSPTIVNTTTSLTENSPSGVVTKKNKDFKNVDASPRSEQLQQQQQHLQTGGSGKNVKLFINPLSSKEIYPNGLNGLYTKLSDSNHCEPSSVSENSSSESLSDMTPTSDSSSTARTSCYNYLVETHMNVATVHHHAHQTSISSGHTDRDSGFESQTDSLALARRSLDSAATASAPSGLDIPPNKKRNSDGTTTAANFLLDHLDSISDGVSIAAASKSDHHALFAKSHSFDEKNDHAKLNDIENSLVHSWSYCLSDSERLNCELEVSTPAEEFFKGGDQAIIAELIGEILDHVCGVDATTTQKKQQPLTPKSILKETHNKNFAVYPMHHHMCLYYNIFDSDLILYGLHTLRNSILSNPQLFVQCLATTGLSNLKSNDILYLLARHRKSLLGAGFFGDVSQEHVNFYRGYMFLDTLISICLNFARTFYPNLDNRKLTHDEIVKNLKIQLASLEVLHITIKHVIIIVKENSKGFSSYIADMLVKCKLQKILLHCLLTSVRNFDEDMTFAEDILLFNNFQLYNSHKKICEHVEAFQIQLLRLIQSLIILEYHVFPKQESLLASAQGSQGTTGGTASNATGEHLTYTPTILIPEQQMFLSAIMSALRHHNMKSLHENWCNMVTSCLPYFGQNLKQIALSVIHQICNNIEKLADTYRGRETAGELCSDYAITQLNSLTILCHYCLLDSSQSSSAVASSSGASGQQQTPGAAGAAHQGTMSSSGSTPLSNPSEILNNLVAAFFAPTTGELLQTTKQNSNHYQTARKTILSHMPRIIVSVAKLWQTIVNVESDFNGIYGNSRIVKQQLLEFLSPISIHHGASFLAAVAVAWFERRNRIASIKTVLPEPNTSQSNLVYLISAIRVIPLDNLVQTVTAVIRNPPPTEGLSSDVCLEVSVLELFYCYMRNASATQLSEAWSSLLTLIREGCSLSPPSQFLLAAVLHELMIKCCPLEERKDQKDLQDVTHKLIECVSQVCGSCLEQTTWLRRNLAVREDEPESLSSSVATSGSSQGSNSSEVSGPSSMLSSGTSNNHHSVQAQLVLSEILAPILDICFGSSEKDKVNAILGSLMYNIVPYLKTHTTRNMPSFHACSKLLASLSSYQYTRKAWRKDVFDLLMDNALFQMDYSCLKYWKIIVDNLMTHDNTTFRDLMNRVSITQSGSLNLFSSKEQEYEQKAQLLKRLAFVIFCSETDQYAKYMPDIQEQLNTNLRLNVPGIQAQVFLCFRVLLIRMTPMHVTSLWPIVISEMLQVFLQVEQELATDTEEFSSHIKLLSALDASWATNANNGLHALGNPHYFRLHLATAKLLDLALLLPANALPQFQMYRWAFVGDDLVHSPNSVPPPLNQQQQQHRDAVPTFVPHVTRIANLMDQKFTDTQIETLPTRQNELLLGGAQFTQLKDLHGFFKTLSLCSNRHRTECCGSAVPSDFNLQDKQADKKFNAILERIDRVVEQDFLDKIAK